MNTFLPIAIGKTISTLSRVLKKGNGSTWPGHIALKINPNLIKDILRNANTKIILIAGTNGKTTTSKLITTILTANGEQVIQNNSGANLKNGIASTILLNTTKRGKLMANYAVFEVDENILPIILKDLTPNTIIVLNLFRDQLDRYGELDTIAKKWKDSFTKLTKDTTLILNADDPLIASLGEKTLAKVLYFGLDEKTKRKTLQHASDSIYCPKCHTKLKYKTIYYSHLGNWVCPTGDFKRPNLALDKSFYPLAGTYNKYNTLAASLFCSNIKIEQKYIEKYLKKANAAFGRQEKIYKYGKNIQIYLAKNPTGFNENLQTISSISKAPQSLLLILNDRIPDGLDISWIWDIDFEQYINKFQQITISGDRTYDMALRLLYTQEKNEIKKPKLNIETNVENAIKIALKNTKKNQTLYILPTYSAMLETRKVLTGKKIL